MNGQTPASALAHAGGDLPAAAASGLPTCSFAPGQLHHIGTLNPADKGRVGPSHEGNGLSVSTHPHAWEAIARLGGLPWWQLRRDGNRFLDAHALTRRQRATMAAWAVTGGLATRAAGWRVCWHDAELGEQRAFVCLDAEEAAGEAAEVGGRVTPTTTLVATARLHRLVGGWRDHGLTWDHVLIAYAEPAGLVGVWFADELHVAALSVPRGVIVPARLPAWTVTSAPTSLDDPSGDEPW